ncbi:MAG: NAD(P)/FAD-dependent oxidoreductase [Zestosphaera sp.]
MVGAGPGGLLSSYALLRKGFRTEVHEEHDRVGLPRHCSGLVSEYVVRTLGSLAKPHVLSKFNEYRVRTLEDGLIHDASTLRFREPVYLMDRVEFEASLSEVVESCGGRLVLRSRITDLNTEQAAVKTRQGWRRGDLLIISEGAARSLVSEAGLCVGGKSLVGPQALVRLGRAPETVEVMVSPIFGSEGFGWVIPVDDRRAIVGLLTSSRMAGNMLRYLIRKIARHSYEAVVERFFGGTVPADRPCKNLVSRKYLVVGDAASLTKPITKGGLYPLVEEVRALGDSVRSDGLNVDVFNFRYRGILRLINSQHRMLDVICRLGGYYKLVKSITRPGLKDLRLLNYDKLLPDPSSLLPAYTLKKLLGLPDY